jgi:hypothetical protein
VPAASQTITRAKAKASAAAVAAVSKPIPESQIFDEFVAHSDSDDEGEMHEVEANLQASVASRGASLVTCLAILLYQPVLTSPRLLDLGVSLAEKQAHSPRAKGSRTSRRLQGSSPNIAALTNSVDSNGDEEEDELEEDLDAELLERVRKLESHAQVRELGPPLPPLTASRKKVKSDDNEDEPERSSSEEIFPSPGTRAGAEKRRRTQAAKAAPYVPPRGTRAASMVEKGRTRDIVVRRK